MEEAKKTCILGCQKTLMIMFGRTIMAYGIIMGQRLDVARYMKLIRESVDSLCRDGANVRIT